MPTAILKFQLPEERSDHHLAMRAGEMHSALWDIAQDIRSRLKYGEPSEAEVEMLEKLRAHIPSFLWEE